ncbi:EAL domain-containing protein [Sphingomonas aracearum]|uniref:EAL domain-containing protein n=2 Tax=Sphingomonas aracearum TaxID=2283317 RepID=A0A369VUM6_9SPHN|nr:EAL domain-containing protein [Sphingomonas aracearum]
MLVEIGNHAVLRRHVGRARANSVGEIVGERLSRSLRGVRVAGAGRNLIEVEWVGSALCELEDALTDAQVSFDAPVAIDGEEYRIELVVGAAATSGVEDEDGLRLLEEAEVALEKARSEGRPIWHDISGEARVLDRLALSRELGTAIDDGQMFLQYQPKLHCRRQEITSAEALVRWQHPTRGLILPGDFITMAEDMREIGALTLWTLAQVIRDQATLVADGRDLEIFINISGQLLSDKKFVAEACAMIADASARIGFEITETAVIRDPEIAIQNLNKFARAGITIAIDDYGAGLSSLAYLKQLPARELKIDKLFVLQLTSSNRDPLIVRSTIDLAHALEMEVTAEGVETEAAMALLTVMGCDMAQGFLISRPLSLDAFRAFLREERVRATDRPADGAMLQRPASFWRSSAAGGA